MQQEVQKLRQWVSVAHHIDGRVRFKIKSGIVSYAARLKKNAIEEFVSQFPALKSYRLNLSAGSLVLEYDPEVVAPQAINDLFSDDQQRVAAAYQTFADLVEQTQQAKG